MPERLHGQPFPIWVLNLERSVERRRFIQAQLDGMGLNYEFLAAVDGLDLSAEDLALYSKSAAMRSKFRELGRGEIGCALTHIRAWQKLLEEGHDAALVLEDDVMIGEMLLRVLDRHAGFPADWELVNFRSDARPLPFGKPLTDIYRLCRFATPPNGAVAYLLSRDGAHKLLAQALPIRWPSDDHIAWCGRTGLRVYGVDPQVTGHRGGVSDIWMQDDYEALQRSYAVRVLGFFRKLRDMVRR